MMRRRGVAVLEAIVAITILAVVGTSVSSLVLQASEGMVRQRAREALIRSADAALTAHALLDRRDLDLRLGTRSIGALEAYVSRPEPDLYRVSIVDSAARTRELLATLLFRHKLPTARR